MKDTDAAWAAGFLDGEGTLDITKELQPRIRAPQVDPAPLLRLQELFGGTIRNVNPRPGVRSAPMRVWEATRPEMQFILESIEPYLIVKKQHAKVLLEFLTGVRTGKLRNDDGTNSSLSEEELRVRVALYAEIKDLNRKFKYKEEE